MNYAITVPTPFNDISELAESFASRVDDERLMLPHSELVPEGEWVQFAVTLADGSAALSGVGRCTGSYDNGEERAPEHRFDVVLDSLQLEEMAQIYFERILQVRAAQMGQEEQTGQVELPADEQLGEHAALVADDESQAFVEEPLTDEFPIEEAGSVEPHELAEVEYGGADPLRNGVEADAFAQPTADAVAEWDDAEATQLGALPSEEMAMDEEWSHAPAHRSSVPPRPPRSVPPARSSEPPTELRIPEQSSIYELPEPSVPGALPSPHRADVILTRPAILAGWSPEPQLRPEPAPSTGLFAYAAGAALPQPAEPPRPDLDPALRVLPAPRPGDAHAVPVAMASGGYAGASYDHARASYEYDDPSAYADDLGQNTSKHTAVDAEEIDATLDAEYPVSADETHHEADIGDMPYGDETSVSVELPDDER